ncbi:hypothetical protein ACFYYB_33420 [Streptomyces sp. NPDC002886]|uniref:hypothetical protein n=1 Tax=Streptomyces sp. NPDC002886 TaxID=3364667 RepID=UPI0036AC0DD3
MGVIAPTDRQGPALGQVVGQEQAADFFTLDSVDGDKGDGKASHGGGDAVQQAAQLVAGQVDRELDGRGQGEVLHRVAEDDPLPF